MLETEFLVVGAGPTGIGAALRLEERGRAPLLLESSPWFGGLASSFVDEKGFTWDLGGHVVFSHYDRFDRFFDLALQEEGYLTHSRQSWVWIRGRFVPYPFQNNLHRLDPEDRYACVAGLLRARELEASPENFAEWLRGSMGDGLCELFLLPYNEKVWAYPPESLGFGWIGERVAVPDLTTVLRAICFSEDQVSWGPNTEFRFPSVGGTGRVWENLGRRLPADRVHLGEEVVRIDSSRREVETSGGLRIKYRHLVSTMPLDLLIRAAPGVVDATVADGLVYHSTYVVGVGLEGQPPPPLTTKSWMYFPERNSPYYRVTVFSNYSPRNVPEPGEQWSLMAEVSESSAKPVDRERLVEDVIRAMTEDELVPDPAQVISTTVRRLERGYPTPFLGRDSLVDPALRAYEAAGIYSRGRFGAWKYEVSNQDHSFAQGYECADRLTQELGPEAEPTLHTPNLVNSRRNP
ncbi:MAG: protoporphyrinogen/coproporphyrinogen oxidase [Planctomycetota bacterium]|jgi:protoporphyrinogen oxidase